MSKFLNFQLEGERVAFTVQGRKATVAEIVDPQGKVSRSKEGIDGVEVRHNVGTVLASIVKLVVIG